MLERTIEHTCKILPLGTITSIIIAVNISFSAMMVGIFAGIPMFANVLLLVGLLWFIISMISTNATFSISQTTLSRTLNKESKFFKNVSNKEYEWKDIKTFKKGTDRGKYRGEYQYLEIKFIDGKKWSITDTYGENKESYNIYLSSFFERVNEFNESKIQEYSPIQARETQPTLASTTSIIKQEKTFYETIFAKIFTILFGLFIIEIFNYSLSATAWFKLIVVLIPGFAYMVYRTFIKKSP